MENSGGGEGIIGGNKGSIVLAVRGIEIVSGSLTKFHYPPPVFDDHSLIKV